MKKAVVLVSGGLDSATVLALVEQMGYEIYALSFNYMQHHSVELKKAITLVSHFANVRKHQIINIDLRTFGGSALTDSDIKVPKYQNHLDLGDEIPLTYVPARNTIFLSYALGYAEITGASDIFIGVHATDYANYPDCRPEYIKSFESMANLALAATVKGEFVLKINTPLIDMTKAEIVKVGLTLGVDYSNTISCYDPSEAGVSCGKCHSCLTRLAAFAQNDTIDPIAYSSL